MLNPKVDLKEFETREFALLIGMTIATVFEAIVYAWIEV
jgi:hypothetical protein